MSLVPRRRLRPTTSRRTEPRSTRESRMNRAIADLRRSLEKGQQARPFSLGPPAVGSKELKFSRLPLGLKRTWNLGSPLSLTGEYGACDSFFHDPCASASIFSLI